MKYKSKHQIKYKIEYLNANREVMKNMSIKAKETFGNYQTRDDNYQNRVKRLYKQYEK